LGYNLFAGSDSDVSSSTLPYFLPDGFAAGDVVDAANVNGAVPDHLGAIFLPSLAGGLGIVYNIPGEPQQLNFDAVVLGNIFTGRLEWWNDTSIKNLNQDATLPNEKIRVVGRGGSSGSTQVFTNYMATYGNVTVSSSPVWYLNFTLITCF
jgi:ABC-type phosphate transport system substrate-binding protein